MLADATIKFAHTNGDVHHLYMVGNSGKSLVQSSLHHLPHPMCQALSLNGMWMYTGTLLGSINLKASNWYVKLQE